MTAACRQLRGQQVMSALIELWVLISALLVTGGWVLSAIGRLDARGYVVWLLLTALGCGLWRRWAGSPMVGPGRRTWHRLGRRLRRPLPAGFALLVVLAILGGILHPPANLDGLNQRVPRVLNWLAESRWHWIDGAPSSFNTWPCNFEWLSTPIILFTNTDRWVFLLNTIGFMLLPGLVFSVWTRCGVRPRVAWYWMWLLPTGYCYLLQAASVYNDAFGAVYVLAAMHFALRARTMPPRGDLELSLLAAALMTAVKPVNLALLLPWLVAVGPALPALAHRPARAVLCGLVAVLVSFAPTAFYNHRYCGDWTGITITLPEENFQPSTVAEALLGNTVVVARDNLTPPVFPLAGWWNSRIPPRIPTPVHRALDRDVGRGREEFHLPELQVEESTGLGLGLVVLAAAAVVAARRACFRVPPAVRPQPPGRWGSLVLLGSPYVATFAYMATMIIPAAARYLASYYPLLLPVWLVGASHNRVVRTRWWQLCSLAVVALAVVVLAVNPSRPLWPAVTVAGRLREAYPDSPAVERLERVYSVYARRWDGMAPVRALLPAGADEIGVLACRPTSYSETSLWRPFGLRRIRYLKPENAAEMIARYGLRYVVVGAEPDSALVQGRPFAAWFADWQTAVGGEIMATARIQLLASRGDSEWYVIRIPR